MNSETRLIDPTTNTVDIVITRSEPTGPRVAEYDKSGEKYAEPTAQKFYGDGMNRKERRQLERAQRKGVKKK